MDLKILETGNGGDAFRLGNDFALINGFQNMPYLAMFGGNVEMNTPRTRTATEQVFDYWGNSLLFNNQPEIQFNSNTERILRSVALNSASRIDIQNAVTEDLKFMRAFSTIKVDVSLFQIDKVRIIIKITSLDNLDSTEFVYLWDSTKQELINDEFLQNNINVVDFALFDDDDFGLFDDGSLIEF